MESGREEFNTGDVSSALLAEKSSNLPQTFDGFSEEDVELARDLFDIEKPQKSLNIIDSLEEFRHPTKAKPILQVPPRMLRWIEAVTAKSRREDVMSDLYDDLDDMREDEKSEKDITRYLFWQCFWLLATRIPNPIAIIRSWLA